MQKKKVKVDRHHRKPQSIGGTDDPENISIVKITHHRNWHLLFENKSVPEIVRLLNKYWIDPDYQIYYKEKEKGDKNQLKLFK